MALFAPPVMEKTWSRGSLSVAVVVVIVAFGRVDGFYGTKCARRLLLLLLWKRSIFQLLALNQAACSRRPKTTGAGSWDGAREDVCSSSRWFMAAIKQMGYSSSICLEVCWR